MKLPEKDARKLIKDYGRSMKLVKQGNETVFKAFLQPLRYKNKMYLNAVATELRYDSSRKYLLIAPPDVDLSDADGYEAIITDENSKYVADRAEKIYFGDTPLYTWAVVTAM